MTRPAPPLRTRLVIGNLALIITALAVTWGVATVAGPPLFRNHIATPDNLPTVFLDRAEQAFHVANLLEVLLATLLALTLTVAASLLISRVVSARIGEMTTLAADIAAGNYATRLPQRRTSRELDALTDAVNHMAAELQSTEATRRRLLTDLAHELRTPIATLDGYLEAIQDGVEQADAETIGLLRRQVRRLTRLADDLRAVSSADEDRLRLDIHSVPVDELARHAVRVAKPAFVGKGVELRLHVGNGAHVMADPVRLEQVLANVLNNALRHTPAGGAVTVSSRTEGRRVTLSVTDTGEGIDPEHLPHLFERFYRAHTRDDGQGSGVGLTISRAIVAAHDGTITVDSPGPGRGSTVAITLPLSSQAGDGR